MTNHGKYFVSNVSTTKTTDSKRFEKKVKTKMYFRAGSASRYSSVKIHKITAPTLDLRKSDPAAVRISGTGDISVASPPPWGARSN